MDAALTYETRGDVDVEFLGLPFEVQFPDVVDIAIPISSFRLGFYVSDAVSIEPAMRFRFSDVEDLSSNFLLGLLTDVLYDIPSSDFFLHGGAAFQAAARNQMLASLRERGRAACKPASNRHSVTLGLVSSPADATGGRYPNERESSGGAFQSFGCGR